MYNSKAEIQGACLKRKAFAAVTSKEKTIKMKSRNEKSIKVECTHHNIPLFSFTSSLNTPKIEIDLLVGLHKIT